MKFPTTAVRVLRLAAFLALAAATVAAVRADTSFTGAVDNDWVVTGNWSDGLPSPDVAAQISAASTVLSGGPEQVIGNLAISSGQSASILGGALLTGSGLGITAGLLIADGAGTVVSFGGDSNIQLGLAGTGVLTISNGAQFNALAGSGRFQLGASGGTGTINLISGGILSAEEIECITTGTITLNGGVFQAAADSANVFQNFAASNITISSNGATIDTKAFNIAVTNGIAGNRQLTKTGSGTLTLNGTSTYSGGTRVENGLLIVASSGGLGNSEFAGAATAVGSNSAVQINAGVTLSKSISFNSGASLDNRGTITSLLGVLSSGAGGGNLRNSGAIASTFADGVYIQDGVGNVTNTGGSITGQSGNGALLRNGGTVINENAGTISGSGLTGASGSAGVQFETNAGTVRNLSGSTISGTVYGVRLLAGGSVTNSGGSIIQTVGNGGRNGIFGQGSTVDVQNLGTSSITGRSVGVLLTSGGSVYNEGTITGAQVASATNAGVRFTNVAASLTNKGTINGGVLMSGHAHSATLYSGSLITSNLNMSTNTSARLVLTGTGAQVYSAAVLGTTTLSGTLEKSGSGTWTLDRSFASITGTTVAGGNLRLNATNAGTMLVQAQGTLSGTGRVTGGATIDGTLSPGQSPGLIAFGSNLTLNSSARAVMELNGYSRGISYDAVNVFGSLKYGGILEIVFLEDFLPSVSDTFDFFDNYTSFEGDFAGIEFSKAGYGGTFNTSTGVLTITTVPEPSTVLLLVAGAAVALSMRRRLKPGKRSED